MAEAAYVGMLSLKQLETYNLNELPDAYLPLGTAQNAAVRNPFLGAFPGYLVAGPGGHRLAAPALACSIRSSHPST